MKRLAGSAALALTLVLGPVPGQAQDHHDAAHIEDIAFPWEGPFGRFDQFQLQRGLQVYTEVCKDCHGLRYVPFRTLGDDGGVGLPADQVRAYAAQYDVFDAELDDTRPAIASDHFPGSGLPNAPDLSLIAKNRTGFSGPYGLGVNQFFRGTGGPEYVVAILTGYTGEEKEEAGTTLYENRAFPGGWIAMPPPMEDGRVEFEDKHPNDLHHMAEDAAAFLTWAAEPKMMARKHSGFLGVFFLGLLTVLLYLTNKRLWAPHKGRKKTS
jgi:ubiquinol-cytochrome c reductase cytochrome c1 subunit